MWSQQIGAKPLRRAPLHVEAIRLAILSSAFSTALVSTACGPALKTETTPAQSEREQLARERNNDVSVAPGCHSGVRVGFVDAERYPQIAACAGGWDTPGLVNPSQAEGNAAALCADGWHVCSSVDEVKRATKGEGCAAADIKRGGFFAIAEGIFEAPQCFTRGSVGVLGCGSLGAPAPAACSPLVKVTNPGCSALEAPWACEKGREVWSLTKPKHEAGGVLCCQGQASEPKPSTSPWSFLGGVPVTGSGQAGCGELTLTTTNTEPWGDGMFRNSPNDSPSVVVVTFSGRAKSFHVSARLSGKKAYIKGFNVAPTHVGGLADFDGQRVQTPKGIDQSTVMLSWVNTHANAFSWVVGGQERHTVMLDGYRVDCE